MRSPTHAAYDDDAPTDPALADLFADDDDVAAAALANGGATDAFAGFGRPESIAQRPSDANVFV